MNSSHNQGVTATAGGASSIKTPANSGGSGLFGGHSVGATHGEATNPSSADTASSTSGAGGKAGMFDAQGSIGKAFTTDGIAGSTAQAIGGPFDKEGVIGKQFTTEGSIGGSVQNSLGGGK